MKIISKNGELKGFVKGKMSSEKFDYIQTSESELNNLIPDSFEETDWKEVRRHYKLVDGELVFDEDYEPDDEGV